MPIRQVELVVRRPGHPERRLILGVGTIHLGRGEDNEIVLPDIGVSRRHAQIRVDPSSVVVSDLSSGNGTFVGGQRIAAHTVRDGDEVFIDPFVLAFHVKAEQAVLPPSPAPDSPSGAPTLHYSERDAAVQARLVVLQGQRLNASYQIAGPRLTMGRAENHDVVLFDPAASRQHAEIRANGNDYWVVDPGSANGTFVNGHRIRETRLKHGDRIRVGATEFRFEVLQSVLSHEPPADRLPGPPPAARGPHWSEITGRTEPKTREPAVDSPPTDSPPIDSPPSPAIIPPRATPPPIAPRFEQASPPPIERASPPPPPIVPRPASPASEIPRGAPPPVSPLADSPDASPPSALAPTVESTPTPIDPARSISPPHDPPTPPATRARMGETIVPEDSAGADRGPNPLDLRTALGTGTAHGGVRRRGLGGVDPAVAVRRRNRGRFLDGPTAALRSGGADAPRTPHPARSSPVAAERAEHRPVNERLARRAATGPPEAHHAADVPGRVRIPRCARLVRRSSRRRHPRRSDRRRLRRDHLHRRRPRARRPPSRSPPRGTVRWSGRSPRSSPRWWRSASSARRRSSRSPTPPGCSTTRQSRRRPTVSPRRTRRPRSRRSGWNLLKTPALSADAARAFYHAARLDPADAANARMAAVACESAALVELRYDIERRALSEAEKQRARDEALTAAGDETRQAALERAARLVPSDADLRAALDAARQKRLDEIRQAFAADSAQRPVSGG